MPFKNILDASGFSCLNNSSTALIVAGSSVVSSIITSTCCFIFIVLTHWRAKKKYLRHTNLQPLYPVYEEINTISAVNKKFSIQDNDAYKMELDN